MTLDLDALDKQHIVVSCCPTGRCDYCGESWPCPTSTLIQALRIAREALAEGADVLRRISDLYGSALAADITEVEAVHRMEVILRRPTPEGEIVCYELADALARIAALVDLGEPR